MAFRIVRHPSGVTQGGAVFVADHMKVSFMVDLERSTRAPTAEVADQLLNEWVRSCITETAKFLSARMNSVPQGIVVEIFIE